VTPDSLLPGAVAATPTRVDPPYVGEERVTLLGFLDYHRSTLMIKCGGLSAVQLATRAVAPSELSLLGIVRHLAEVERRWFQFRVASRPVPMIYCTENDEDGDFHLPDADIEMTVRDAFATWRAEVAATDEIVAGSQSLDQISHTEQGGAMTLRWVLVHMIEEYARHNGHADLLREAIDGATGE
jgi:hypothetical protein